MNEVSSIQQKSKNLVNIQTIAQVIIAFMSTCFTGVYGYMGLKNAGATLELSKSNYELAKSNLELAKSEVKISLLPSITDERTCRRTVALNIAKRLDQDFAVDIANSIVESDPDEQVRENARSVLEVLRHSNNAIVKEKAKTGADQYDIASEIRSRGLLNKLKDARGYLEGGNPSGVEDALKLYHEVIIRLSDGAIRKLDVALLRDAQEDEKAQYKEHAARKYRVLFQEYVN